MTLRGRATRPPRGTRGIRPSVFDTPRAHGYHPPILRTPACVEPTARRSGFFLSVDRSTARRSRNPSRSGVPARVNTKPTYLSRDGLHKLREELEEMVTVRRPEIAQRIHDAK